MDDLVGDLGERGSAWVRRRFDDPEDAFAFARALIGARGAADRAGPRELVGDYVLPPAGTHETRDFQTLHFDFGLPVDPKVAHDVGRYTALHIPAGFGSVYAATRLVPLAALLSQRAWPSQAELRARLSAYGRTHGAWDDDQGYVEGSLARIVEAAAAAPALPSVKAEPGFLCGTEFGNLGSELDFFKLHSLSVEDVQTEVALSPGELLVFDNVALAHGRRGVRRPGELRQWVFGDRALGVEALRELRDRLLACFDGSTGGG